MRCHFVQEVYEKHFSGVIPADGMSSTTHTNIIYNMWQTIVGIHLSITSRRFHGIKNVIQHES